MMNEKRLVYVKCNNCKEDNYRVLFPSTLDEDDFDFQKSVYQYTGTTNEYDKYARIVKCNCCGLIYENPRDKVEYILENYSKVVDNDYLATKKERQDEFALRLGEIEELSPKGALLDVGCYGGFFLEVAGGRGWSVFGIEPSSWAKDYAKSKGLKVIASTLDETHLSDESFDVVTMWDVIEHLFNPKETLPEINRILKPDGILALSTHNPESLAARILGRRYPFFMRMHLYHFTPKVLEQMLVNAGFQMIKIKSNGRKFRVSYLINRFKIKNNSIKKILTGLIKYLRLDSLKIYVDFKDTYQIYARKISE